MTRLLGVRTDDKKQTKVSLVSSRVHWMLTMGNGEQVGKLTKGEILMLNIGSVRFPLPLLDRLSDATAYRHPPEAKF